MTSPSLAQVARQAEPYVLRLREELHRIPELRFEGHPSLVNAPAEVERVRRMLQTSAEETGEGEIRFGARTSPGTSGRAPAASGSSGPTARAPPITTRRGSTPDPAVLWRGVHYWLILATAPPDAAP